MEAPSAGLMNPGSGPSLPMFAPPMGGYGTNKDVMGQTSAVPMSAEMAALYGMKPRPRPVFNLGAMVLAIAVPWLIFVAAFFNIAFFIHYQYPACCFAVCAMLAALVVFLGISAVNVIQRSRFGGDEPSWSVFIFGAALIALLAGALIGQVTFLQYMRPFYDVNLLNTYPSVDPAVWGGESFMDAGKIEFVPGTKLDLSKNMGFLDHDMYCIVPIVSPAGASLSYDFWAVGTNCCTTQQYDYRCGEYNNVRAHSGLRLMKEYDRPFFRLAVQQAEATYNIKTRHPIFFYWMEKPSEEVAAYADLGTKAFMVGASCFFAFNLFLVIVAMFIFAKMGRL